VPWGPILALLASALFVYSCAREPAPDRGSVVLITLSGVRADAVGAAGGEAGRTPYLDEFAAEADWVGTAVLASSDPLPALGSLLTGVNPWKHQLLASEYPHRRRVLPTLAQILSNAGYHATARVPRSLRHPGYGLVAGFEHVRNPVSDEEAGAPEDAEFLWLHFPDADVAYRWRRERTKKPSSQSDPRLGLGRILAYADPRKPLPPALRDALLAFYRQGVTTVDRKLGALLGRMRRSGRWGDTLLVITASHGTELGEHGQILHGENLGRESIEVPVLIKLPAHCRRPLAEPTGGRIAQARLWATVVEAVGAEAAPVHEPSLFRRCRAPIVSELYLRNGINRFSLLAEDLQLHWTTRFAPPEPQYYQARRSATKGRRAVKRIFNRLERSFRQVPPLTGPPRPAAGAMPEIHLERWTEDGFERVDDPDRAATLAVELMRRWMQFLDGEHSPQRELRGEPPPTD